MSPVEKEPLRTFHVQLKAVDGGPWPPEFEVEAHTVCEKEGKLIFKTDGEVSGRVTGEVTGWWAER